MPCSRAALSLLGTIAVCSFLVACGSAGGSSSSEPPKNIQTIVVSGGPDNNYANGLFATVTVCEPGSSNCQSIPNVLVDTGSYGLRLLASAVGSLSGVLPQQTGSDGNPVFECAQFVDSVTWGPVRAADVVLANETAKSVPVELIDASSVPVPSGCKAIGPAEEDVTSLGANGILGIGLFITDCGDACAPASAANPGFYYSCMASTCSVVPEPLNMQVQNPVALFTANNNGVVISLPAVSGSSPGIGGSIVLGIGTAENNTLASAAIFPPDKFGNLLTTFKGKRYASFLDTGSNAYFFLDSKTTGIAACASSEKGFYCPSSPVNLSATNSSSQSGSSNTVNFTIVSASQLFSNNNDFVFPSLGGPNPSVFDWGLPFFMGRKVFVAIEGRPTPGGSGPYWAY
jgi:hypothetical protein